MSPSTLVQACLAVTFFACAASCSSESAVAEEPTLKSVVGVASVIDGDTIEVRGDRIRLNGFDTPERGAMCGTVNVYQKAALALSDFIGSQNVECEISGTDRYDRLIGVCSVKGTDLGSHMVQSGWGRDWPRYSAGKYAADEKAARSGKKGLWGLNCGADLWGSRSYD